MASNGSVKKRKANGKMPAPIENIVNYSRHEAGMSDAVDANPQDTAANMVICASGIYAAFLTWGVLQERITTTNYGTDSKPEVFKYPVVVNTVQSTFAAILGYIYTRYTRQTPNDKPVFPSRKIIWPLTLVALTSALSSPFGYASLAHVDYITFILAKSCKLLPVMFLHVTLYRRKYPFYKYAVVALVTAGVAIFTLHQPAGSKKKGSKGGSSLYGLMLLGINLLFDGLTNATQDEVNSKFKPFSGQQMMCALNVMQTLITSAFLLLSPYIAQTGIGHYVGMDLGKTAGELDAALAFISKHPSVGYDILAFAACGAIGQLFIFYTLSIFGSLFLVTITVTRKMLTMMLSVFWFGHSLNTMQWGGVGCVFFGVFLEAYLGSREKAAKAKKAKESSRKAA